MALNPKTALIILAPGVEETEFMAVHNVLRRAQVQVTVAALSGTAPVKGAHDILLVPDKTLSEVSKIEFDMVVLPGGSAASDAYTSSTLVGQVLKAQENGERYIAAICAAPLALSAHKIYSGKTITAYPSLKDRVSGNFKYVDKDIYEDGKLITGKGPGQAIKFGLKCSEALIGFDRTRQISYGMLLDW